MKVEDNELEDLLLNEGVQPRIVWVKGSVSDVYFSVKVERGVLVSYGKSRKEICSRKVIGYTKANFPELWL